MTRHSTHLERIVEGRAIAGRPGSWALRLALLGGLALPPLWGYLVTGYLGLAALSAGLGWMLLYLAYQDARTYRLPNRATLPLLLAGLIAAFVLPGTPILDHLLGAAAGYLLLWGLAAGYRRWRGREGLGLGDAKLLAAGGAWVGWQALPTVVIYAALSGLSAALLRGVARRRQGGEQPMPFGPFLALGIWLVWLYGPLIWNP